MKIQGLQKVAELSGVRRRCDGWVDAGRIRTWLTHTSQDVYIKDRRSFKSSSLTWLHSSGPGASRPHTAWGRPPYDQLLSLAWPSSADFAPPGQGHPWPGALTVPVRVDAYRGELFKEASRSDVGGDSGAPDGCRGRPPAGKKGAHMWTLPETAGEGFPRREPLGRAPGAGETAAPRGLRTRRHLPGRPGTWGRPSLRVRLSRGVASLPPDVVDTPPSSDGRRGLVVPCL